MGIKVLGDIGSSALKTIGNAKRWAVANKWINPDQRSGILEHLPLGVYFTQGLAAGGRYKSVFSEIGSNIANKWRQAMGRGLA